jgi:ribose transport system permease protein
MTVPTTPGPQRTQGRDAQTRVLSAIRHHWMDGPAIAGLILLGLLVTYALFASLFTSFQFQNVVNDSTTLALAALGETLVVLTGGFDISAGAIMAVVNVVLSTHLAGAGGNDLLAVVIALVIGTGAGLLNGVLVAYLRLQSIIVTIATLFIYGGIALSVLAQPGGSVPSNYVALFTGTTLGIPRALVLIAAAGALWFLVKRTWLGSAIYAIGANRQAAYMSGVPVRRALLLTYGLAGFFYGLASVFYTAQTATGDPRVSTSLLLSIFTAVVLGGTRFGGGYGGAIGSIIGAFIVTMIVGVIFVTGVDTFYTSIVEGAVLVVAVLFHVLAQRFRPRRASAT